MNLSRYIRITSKFGSLYHFSDTPLQEGEALSFLGAQEAKKFIEQFDHVDIIEFRDLCSWINARLPSPFLGDIESFEYYCDVIVPALIDSYLYVSYIPKIKMGAAPIIESVALVKSPARNSSSSVKASQSSKSDAFSTTVHLETIEHHSTAGDPISLVTGEEILILKDLDLGYEFSWKRCYRSSLCDETYSLGYGWKHSFDLQLHDITDGAVNLWRFINEFNDVIDFLPVNIGSISYQKIVGASCFFRNKYTRVITLSNGVQYKFERVKSIWLIKSIVKSTINSTSLIYSSNNKLIAIFLNDKPCVECNYNKDGQLIQLLSPNSKRVFSSFEYDGLNNLILAINEKGLKEKYIYNHSHLLLQRVRSTGFTHYFEWSGSGKEAKCIRNYGDNGIYNYYFSYQENESTYKNTLGVSWRFVHDANGKLLKKISPEGREWSWNYDLEQRLISKYFPNNTYFILSYNKQGKKIKKKNSSGALQYFHYNQFGQESKIVYPDGEISEKYYNSLGQLLWESTKDDIVIEYKYDKSGRIIQSKNNQGCHKEWWWNDKQHLQAIRINETLICYSYNKNNKINGYAFSNGMVFTLCYDENNNINQHNIYNNIDNTSYQHIYEYDNFGRINTIITPSGNTYIQWSSLAQPEVVSKPDGSLLNFYYDGERNLSSIKRSDGCYFSFYLSPDGNLQRSISFDGIEFNYKYDISGKVECFKSLGRDIYFRYDLYGNVNYLRAIKNNEVIESRYNYSLGGKLIFASNQYRTIQCKYLSHGNVYKIIQGDNEIKYEYNLNNQLNCKYLPDGTVIKFIYTDYGQVESIQVNDITHAKLKFSYDKIGRVYKIAYVNSTEKRIYDGIGRLKCQKWKNRTRKYYYDLANNLSTIIDDINGETHYYYDEIGQLNRTVKKDNVCHYLFDSYGNPISGTIILNGDKVEAQNDYRYMYDEYGNQTHSAGHGTEQRRVFNAHNQLIEIKKDNSFSQYEYDPLGRRCRKITEKDTIDFIWDGEHLIGEINGDCVRWYIYQPHSHTPVMLIENGKCFFYQCDHIGTPLKIVDELDNTVWEAKYTTFGFAQIITNVVNNPLRFQGQYCDEETGLHYNLARYYDPILGRFIQPDPIGIMGGLNAYQYAPNPIVWIDPTGLSCKKEDKFDFNNIGIIGDYHSSQPMELLSNLASSAKVSESIIKSLVNDFVLGTEVVNPLNVIRKENTGEENSVPIDKPYGDLYKRPEKL